MRTIICGGRDFDDVEFIIPRIEKLHNRTPITTLICGMAKGVDTIAYHWAKLNNILVEEYPANWNIYGKAAGLIRNETMLKARPDTILGFPGGYGTSHMLRISREIGINQVSYHYLYFRKEDPIYGFLSNFYAHDQKDENGIVYRTNEHYYQSKKTLVPVEAEIIINMVTPLLAKRAGRSIITRPDWEDIKQQVMLDGLRLKFLPENSLSERLLDTERFYLVEWTPWGDTYWGVDKNYKGKNHLGKLLMLRRDELELKFPQKKF